MKKTVYHATIIVFLFLLLVSGGCDSDLASLSTEERKELADLYAKLGTSNPKARVVEYNSKTGLPYGTTTLLNEAAPLRSLNVIKYLVAKGADVNARRGHSEFNGQTPLHNAACMGRIEVVKLLVSHGADVNARDLDMTPLESAKNGYRIHREMIERGEFADVEIEVEIEKGYYEYEAVIKYLSNL